ncbi:hypothetical protein ACTHGU_14330 [Chitinophagaceae bacterium MMS25-I14]
MACEDEPRNRNTANSRYRSAMHIGMGLVYLLMGCSILYFKLYGVVVLNAALAYALGGLMVAYGLFRLWRGMQDIRANRG